MAGSIFTSFGAGDANATAFMTHLTAMTKGYNALSLTNMDNTTVPAIAAGSLIENNGALFKFDAEDTISTTDPVTSTTVADGTVYIMLVPSGSSISACLTATAPTWSDSKQGWYGINTYANNRYVGISTKSSTSYTVKGVIVNLNGLPLTVGTDGLVLSSFKSFNATELNIRKLNMYAYGDAELFSLSSGVTKSVTIIRPCRLYASLAFITGSFYLQIYANSTYTTINSTSPVYIMDFLPGVYKFIYNGGSPNNIRLIYAEGITTLSVSDVMTIV